MVQLIKRIGPLKQFLCDSQFLPHHNFFYLFSRLLKGSDILKETYNSFLSTFNINENSQEDFFEALLKLFECLQNKENALSSVNHLCQEASKISVYRCLFISDLGSTEIEKKIQKEYNLVSLPNDLLVGFKIFGNKLEETFKKKNNTICPQQITLISQTEKAVYCLKSSVLHSGNTLSSGILLLFSSLFFFFFKFFFSFLYF